MSRLLVLILMAAAAATAMLASGTAAHAFFAGPGSGSASSAVTALAAPTITAATPGSGGTVALSWSAVSPPGSGAVGYYVTRDGGAPAGNCPTVGARSAVTTCVDSGVPIGEHVYRVVAVWRNWTAASAGRQVTVAPEATKFTITASTATPAVGASVDLTITAKDASGATVTGYTGTHSLVFAGAEASPDGDAPTVTDASGTAIAFGTATAIEFTAGVAAAASGAGGEVDLYKAGAAKLTATEGTITTPTAAVLTAAAGTASKLALSASTATPVAATGFNLATTAQDAYGNTATTYTGNKNITFGGASASPSGAQPTVVNRTGTAVNFGSATSLTFTAGVAAVTSSKNGFAKLTNAAPTSVTATDGTISTASELALTVSAGAAARVAVSGLKVSAGSIGLPCLLTCAVTTLGNSGTVKARAAITDASGNVVSAVGATKSVKVTATGGKVAGTPLSIPATGSALSATEFTYTAPASGSFSNTITLASTGYTSATVTASR